MALGNILTVAGILLLLAVIFAIGVVSLQCCINSCHRRHAQQAAAASQTQTQSAPWHRDGGRTAIRGGDPLELLSRSLPVPATVYRPAAPRSNKEDVAVECAVCLVELEDGEVARFLPCCNRGFHAQCVDTWLVSQSTCPLCRINIIAGSCADMGSSSGPAPQPENYIYAANLPSARDRACFSGSGCPTPTCTAQ